ncbi:MAG: inositol 2-dehydrogenase [Deltaproteobacteria bacterium]|jgi:myo-inositol 2-dehydrogenase/D-chiro-inositol 1-dehydrogenase|nr:MAG: inositol 2-dehydrogenase [Deltaproteobacteria bacterium]
MEPVKIGLLGCGRIAQLVHINTLAKLNGARLVAVADTNPSVLKRLKGKLPSGTTFFEDYRELIQTPEIEAVVVCLPNELHAEAAVMAFKHRKHVYLEKPIALNTGEVKDVVLTWKNSGLVGMVGFNLRFNPLYRKLKYHIASERVGRILSVRSTFTSLPRALPQWKKERISGGGVLLDLASHHIDLLYFLFERNIERVNAHTTSYKSEDDTATVEFTLEDGLRVQSFFSLYSIDEDSFEVFGTGGKMYINRYLSFDVEITDSTSKQTHLLKKPLKSLMRTLRSPLLTDRVLFPGRERSYEDALFHFVKAIREKCPVSPNIFDGYKSLVVVEAAERSARTGKEVHISEVIDEDIACK